VQQPKLLIKSCHQLPATPFAYVELFPAHRPILGEDAKDLECHLNFHENWDVMDLHWYILRCHHYLLCHLDQAISRVSTETNTRTRTRSSAIYLSYFVFRQVHTTKFLLTDLVLWSILQTGPLYTNGSQPAVKGYISHVKSGYANSIALTRSVNPIFSDSGVKPTL
jgi:hypothetical protein